MSPPSRPSSIIEANFRSLGDRTRLDRLFEAGSLRLRIVRVPGCVGTIVNTGGGIVGGDRLALGVTLEQGAAVTLTTVAAEKVYRSAGPTSRIDTSLRLAAGARLDWLPQETILFEGADLARRFEVDLAGSARLVAAETIVFGRLASREPAITGTFRDGWRLRRDGRLVFADESRIAGAIGATLDRGAVAHGARAVALLLLAAPDAEAWVDLLRAATAPFRGGERATRVEVGVSARDGVLMARLLAHAPERLNAAMAAALTRLRGEDSPRAWG